MDNAVGIVAMPQELVADFSSIFSKSCRLVKNGFPFLVGLDFMNDQYVWHGKSSDGLPNMTNSKSFYGESTGTSEAYPSLRM